MVSGHSCVYGGFNAIKHNFDDNQIISDCNLLASLASFGHSDTVCILSFHICTVCVGNMKVNRFLFMFIIMKFFTLGLCLI